MNKIRNKLLLAIAFATLPALLGLGLYGSSWTKTALNAKGLQELESRLSVLTARVEGFLASTHGDLLLLADAASLGQVFLALDSGDGRLVDAAKRNLGKDFISMSEKRGIYSQIRFIDAGGSEIIRIDRQAGKSAVVPAAKLQNKKDRPYFSETVGKPKGEVVISPLDLNREGGEVVKPVEPTVRYATPVFDSAGKRRGVVVLNVAAAEILEMISGAAGDDETLLFADMKGFYLSHPDKSKLWGGPDDLNTGAKLAKDYPELASELLSAKPSQTREDDENLIVANPVVLPNSGGQHLGVLIDFVPKAVVFAEAASFSNLFNILLLSAFLITMGVGSAMAYFITKPLVYLTEAVDGMSRGDLEAVIDVDTGDETKTLAVAIERLRKSMKVMIDRYG